MAKSASSEMAFTQRKPICSLLRNLGYAGSFHVDHQPVKAIHQFPLGFCSSNFCGADKHATAYVIAIGGAAILRAVSRIHDHIRRKNAADLQASYQRACQPN